jgi:ATP adenylyltransferase
MAKKIAKKKTSKKTSAKTSAKKSSAAKVVGKIQLGKDVWPMERDVLFRPDRMKYVRKLIHTEGCVFCRAAKETASLDTLCVYKTDHSMVVLNKFPYNSGHVLVLPLKHCGDVNKLSDKEYFDLHDLIRNTMKALDKIYEPGGINVGLNHGAVAGAGIPEHLHYHIIPRWSGDVNFFPLIAETKVLVESLEQTYEKLLGYFSKI